MYLCTGHHYLVSISIWSALFDIVSAGKFGETDMCTIKLGETPSCGVGAGPVGKGTSDKPGGYTLPGGLGFSSYCSKVNPMRNSPPT